MKKKIDQRPQHSVEGTISQALRLRADIKPVVIYKTDESKITFENLFKLYEHDSRFHISCLQDELTFLLGGPLTYTLKRKKLKCKCEEFCKTVPSDNVENEMILLLNVKSIDLHFEELETLIGTFGVTKPSLVCCFETWMIESSAEDLYVLDNCAPMKFQPGKTSNEGVAIYVHESLSFEIIEFGT